MPNFPTKNRRKMAAVNVPRRLHTIVMDRKRQTGRSLESLYAEVIAAGIVSKRWAATSDVADPSPVA